MPIRKAEAFRAHSITEEKSASEMIAPTHLGPANYEHVLELAKGGMGRVDVVLRKEGAFERLYARKRLLPELSHDEEFRRMFLDEARIAGSIRHPNVVSVVDCGTDTSGPFLVMDFVEGMSLFQVLKSTGPEDALPLSVILELGMGCSLGLGAAHAAADCEGNSLGLIHRDLSPQNILLSWQGEVRITDFGIAKATAHEGRTSTGLLKGKWGYMSPEQLSFRPCDHRSDLFTLGILLFEVVTGKRLYGGGGGAKAARRILSEPPLDPRAYRPDCPSEVASLIVQLLQKEPGDRPASAAEVASRIERVRYLHGFRSGAVESYLAENFQERRASSRRSIACALEQTRTVYGMESTGGGKSTEGLSLADLDGRADELTVAELPTGSPHTLPKRRPIALLSWAVSLCLAFAVGGALSTSETDLLSYEAPSADKDRVILMPPASLNTIAKQSVEAQPLDRGIQELGVSSEGLVRPEVSARRSRRVPTRRTVPAVEALPEVAADEVTRVEREPDVDERDLGAEASEEGPSAIVAEREPSSPVVGAQSVPERSSPALVSNLNLWEWQQ